jgi:hypothetical protein
MGMIRAILMPGPFSAEPLLISSARADRRRGHDQSGSQRMSAAPMSASEGAGKSAVSALPSCSLG